MRKRALLGYTSFAAVALLAFAIRLYKIDTPLGLDEIFGYRLARLGLAAVIENSWTDPHPPLHYVLRWLVWAAGYSQSEIAWRWMALSSGVLAVCVVVVSARSITGSFSSILIGLIAATLPSLVYFSQEARPVALLVLLASLSMWLTIALLRDGARKGWWIAWTVTSLLGWYTGYAYLMVVGLQLLFLGLYYYRRVAWWLASIIVIGGSSLLVPFMSSSLGGQLVQHAQTDPLTFWRTMQTLFAGEPLRYGYSLSHTLFPWVVLGLCLVAMVRTIRLGDRRLLYVVLQGALPLAAFFALSPILDIRLTVIEAKQFIVLMPALLALMASGLAELCHWLGRRIGVLVAIALCAVLFCLNALGLQAYWTNPRSPEGLAVLRLDQHLQPGEKVVSLHYATNHALEYYTSGIPVYVNPRQEGDTFRYQLTESGRILDLPPTWPRRSGAEEIRANGQFWILAHSSVYREPVESLIVGCQVLEQETFPARNASFDIMKVECPSDG